MLLEILIALLLGIVIGTITGLIPGIHINLVATILFLNSVFFLSFTSPIILACFIVSMSITHTYIDFLPSIFLGAPDENTALSTLPGHRLLLRGRGYEAVKLTVIGLFLGVILSLIMALFFIFSAPWFYPYLIKIMPFLLIALSLFLIIKEEKKFFAFFIFVLSGILGYITLNFIAIKQSLFPLFTGLFGSSLLIISFLQNVKIPKQEIKTEKINKRQVFSAFGLSIISSSLVSFLPGVGSAQAAVIASSLKKIKEKTFLILLGAINSIVLILSFVALYAIQKPRSGVAVFVGKFLPQLSSSQLWLLLGIMLIAGIIVTPLTLFLAKNFSRLISKVNYKKLCLGVLIFLIILTPIISGWLGLLVLITASALGIFCSIIGVKKIFLMGSLLLPVILFYLI